MNLLKKFINKCRSIPDIPDKTESVNDFSNRMYEFLTTIDQLNNCKVGDCVIDFDENNDKVFKVNITFTAVKNDDVNDH